MKATLRTIIDLPTDKRKLVLHGLIEKMKDASLPADFIEAIAALMDDGIAGKVRDVLHLRP